MLDPYAWCYMDNKPETDAIPKGVTPQQAKNIECNQA